MSAEDVIREARTLVAAGGSPEWKELRDRIRELGLPAAAERDALAKLERVGAVHRARASVRPKPAAAPAAPPPRRALLRTRPTITGNMDVRRGDGDALVWRREPSVVAWELRISVKPDPRGDYEVRENGELPGDATRVELPIAETPLRVHLLGRDRGGRLVRRAIVSGLTRETWAERWQRRASAS